jgi:formamidase
LPLSLATPAWLRPASPMRNAQAVPGHNRWHPEIPAVAEVITGGSVRMECQGPREPGAEVSATDPVDPVLCGPVAVVGAEPGDVIVVDVLGIGRSDGRYAGAGHPGIIGCAPAAGEVRETAGDGVLLGHLRPGLASYGRVAAQAVRSAERGREIGGCAIARLTPGSRILLPVHTGGGRLSVGDLHFPENTAGDCRQAPMAGWIDLRINLTKRGVERFLVAGPMLMPDPDGGA